MERISALFIITVLLYLTILAASQVNPRIDFMHIKSDIKFRFATTLVTSRVVNSAQSPVEAHFEVTLPDAAFITDFVMEIDGRIYPGEINEKKKAKEKYDTAKKKGQSAGHVAQKPRHTNRFSVDVNVAAQNKVTFNLTYQELLERVYGEYEHIIYIDPGQVVDDLQIDVAIQENRKLSKISVPPLRNDIISDQSIQEGQNALAVIEQLSDTSATIHYAPTTVDQRQASEQGLSGLFVVEYDIERDMSPGEVLVVDGYFVHFFAPEGMEPVKKNVLFILDVSSSMDGAKIEQQSKAIDKILQDMHEGDNFNLMQFSSKAELWKSQLVAASPTNIQQARKYASRMKAAGWTDINTAMLQGIEFLNKHTTDSKRMKVLVFLTDGQASKGVQDRNLILKNVEQTNTDGVAVFSLAFGKDADYEFVKKVAVKNKGVARKIFEDSDADLQIKGFYDEISSAALRNVSFKYLDDADDISVNTTKQTFDTYFNGKELVVAGKLPENDVKVINLVVTGDGVLGQVELELESDLKSRVPELTKSGDFAKITERIWAYLTIKQLLEKAIGENNENEKKRLNDQALDLSLKYKFVTPLTSMVVTKPDEKDVGSLDENEDAKFAVSASANRVQSAPAGTLANSFSRGGSVGGGVAYMQAIRGANRGRGSGGRGYSTGGGGGGDPHFMLRINGIEFPICFDISAKEKDVMRMLSDKISGLTINAEIIKSSRKDKNGIHKTFIGKIVILAPRVRIDITPEKVLVNGAELSWNDENVFTMFGLRFDVSVAGYLNRVLRINFGNDISVKIKRFMKQNTNQDVSYLNVYIDNEAGLSGDAGGILGQFVHKKTVLAKTSVDSQGRTRGHFREVNGKKKTHFTAILHSKSDVITGELVPCWNLHKKINGLIDESLQQYFKSDVNAM